MGIPRVIIVGAGFGGLAVARALRRTAVDIIIVDRANHHLFQPLLYQVAAAILPPAAIATPIRQLVRGEKNTAVFLAEVSGVDTQNRQILVDYLDKRGAPFSYDFLVLATGATQNYFGHEEYADFAPGLKNLADANSIRDRVLRAFEVAEEENPPNEGILTFVLVGGGPTGVELAGTIAELRRFTLAAEFRRMNPAQARIILIHGGPRILPSFHEDLSKAAQRRLESLGVEVRTNAHVTKIDATGVMIGDERIASRTVIWTAGVKPSPAAKWLGVLADRSGRVIVDSNCSVPSLPGVFVIGDTALFTENGRPLPGVAQVAMQQGKHVASMIAAQVTKKSFPPPFRYFDKGQLAVVGRNYAVLEIGHIRMAGYLAWLVWASVHLLFLTALSNRLQVITQWGWNYFTQQRGSQLILGSGGKNPIFY